MRRLLPLTIAALLFLSPAAAGPLPSVLNTTVSGLALTGTACTTLGSTDGIDLRNATGWRAIAVAPAAATFTGGTAQCCFRSATTGRWGKCDSRLNIALTSGERDVPSVDIKPTVPAGRLAFLGSSVTVSSGSTFSVVYEWVQL